MTSTVLDVTVLLLCVSASVVALGASDPGGPDGPTATDVGDRLVTETATVAYPDADAPNGTRQVHATRAELLALVAARDAETTFDRRALDIIRAGLGPRTRVDAAVEVDERVRPSDGGGPAANGVVREPADAPAVRGGAAAYPGSIASEAVPTRGVEGRGREEEKTSSPRDPVAVGSEPPRSADVAVAVVRQPIPEQFGDASGERRSSEGVVRIVVRRW